MNSIKYLIIGAGPYGLAMAKAMSDASIPYEHVEADSKLGGNWVHGMYESVYTITCKDQMEFTDYPMPEDYPDFLSKDSMLDYLNDYAQVFNLKDKIKFNTKVVWIAAIEENKWKVFFDDGAHNIYRGVIICTGHQWDTKFADLHGNFPGEFIHSKEYVSPKQLVNKRVMVIGAGNSAVDIACEAARVGEYSVLSWRESPWLFPKTFMGVPLGRMNSRTFPSFLQPLLVRILLKLTFGSHELYNLPRPNHKPLEKLPTTSEELPYYLKHGRVTVKPEIKKTEGNRVWFQDDSFMDFNLIVSATGFNLSFPFLPDELVRKEGVNLKVLGYCVYPDYKGLFFLGWAETNGGVGMLAPVLSKFAVDLIKLEEETGYPSGKILKTMGNTESKKHVYGTNEVLNWISKHKYKKLKRMAHNMNSKKHQNKTTRQSPPEGIENIRVY